MMPTTKEDVMRPGPFADQRLHQETDPTSTITTFRGRFQFLSNFYPAPVLYKGVIYPTTEHGYQAAKVCTRWQREHILRCATPGQAKRLAATFPHRPDWDTLKVDIMRDLLWKKFANPDLRALLLETGDRQIEEHNHWRDTFWGIYNGQGLNWLGHLLMELRAQFHAATPQGTATLDLSVPGTLIRRIQQLIALLYRGLHGHHKDQACHVYLNLRFSYDGELHCRIEHHGYLAQEWTEEYRTPTQAAERLIERLIRQLRVEYGPPYLNDQDQHEHEAILRDLATFLASWDSRSAPGCFVVELYFCVE
jgi:ribA/ribD-fused uncharacterized protein